MWCIFWWKHGRCDFAPKCALCGQGRRNYLSTTGTHSEQTQIKKRLCTITRLCIVSHITAVCSRIKERCLFGCKRTQLLQPVGPTISIWIFVKFRSAWGHAKGGHGNRCFLFQCAAASKLIWFMFPGSASEKTLGATWAWFRLCVPWRLLPCLLTCRQDLPAPKKTGSAVYGGPVSIA